MHAETTRNSVASQDWNQGKNEISGEKYFPAVTHISL